MPLKKRTPEEAHKRSVVKAISYRILSMTADTIAAYVITHDVAMTFGIVVFVNGYSTLLYYFHERVWAHVRWGRTRIPEGTI